LFGVAPDPALLEWLVLFFLNSKDIVPAHNVVTMRNSRNKKLFFDGVNIGFDKEDSEFAQTWKARFDLDEAEVKPERIILEVFQLAGGFFKFWSDLGKRAEASPLVFDLESAVTSEKNNWTRKKRRFNLGAIHEMTGISVENLKRIVSEPRFIEGFDSDLVTFLHPLYIKFGFSLDSTAFVKSICPKMGITKTKLGEMLKALMKEEGGNENQVVAKKSNLCFDIESILKV